LTSKQSTIILACMELQQQLGFYLHKAVTLSKRVGSRLFQEVAGITRLQYILLLTLDEATEKPPSQQDIANSLSTTKGAISRQVFILQERGLIQTAPSPTSRREHRLALTTKGHAALKKAKTLNKKLSRQRPTYISDDDLQVTIKTLKKMCEALHELEATVKK
jgi:DNA-binding MarR family transcriptional regulator